MSAVNDLSPCLAGMDQALPKRYMKVLAVAIFCLVAALFSLSVSRAGEPPLRTLVATPLALPGAQGVVDLDYLAVNRTDGLVWVPGGGTGTVDVISADLTVRSVSGFATEKRKLLGRDIVLGPTSVALAGGTAYIGNRADGTVCIVTNLRIRRCIRVADSAEDIATSPDGLAYVSSVKEVWVTRGAPPLGIVPPDHSILVLDAARKSKLIKKTLIPLQGSAEGYSIDDANGRFYTNLIDLDQTVAIDVGSHRVMETWPSHCGDAGPRGLALDSERGLLFVACSDHVVALDALRSGTMLAQMETGAGVDNIDYVPFRHELYVASGATATLLVLQVGDRGTFELTATGSTAAGARVVVADNQGRAFVADPRGGRILVLSTGAQESDQK
jgi:DNA-binding beta-propeller fold protein YncE